MNNTNKIVYFFLLCMMPMLMAATDDLSGLSPVEKSKTPPGVIPEGLVADTEQEAAERVAEVFMDTFLAGNPKPLASLGTDPFSFAGRKVSGPADIEKEWNEVYKRIGKNLPDSKQMKMDVLDYKSMTKKFGREPAKYRYLKIKKCFFAVVQFAKRRGMLLILTKDEKAGWVVTAATD